MFKRSGRIPTMRQLTANARRRDRGRGKHRAERQSWGRLAYRLRRRFMVWRAAVLRTYAASAVPELARGMSTLRLAWLRQHPVSAPVLVAVPRESTPGQAAARESTPERHIARRLGAHNLRRPGLDRALITQIMTSMRALRDGELAPGEMTWKEARLADRFAI